jgi:hypothetical protein
MSPVIRAQGNIKQFKWVYGPNHRFKYLQIVGVETFVTRKRELYAVKYIMSNGSTHYMDYVWDTLEEAVPSVYNRIDHMYQLERERKKAYEEQAVMMQRAEYMALFGWWENLKKWIRGNKSQEKNSKD